MTSISIAVVSGVSSSRHLWDVCVKNEGVIKVFSKI
jgi:hypothetical protein